MSTGSSDTDSWPPIKLVRFYSYFVVASFAIIIYDWALTLGQEIELVWVSGKETLVSDDYIIYKSALHWNNIPCPHHAVDSPVSLAVRYSTILYYFQSVTSIVVNAMLGAIMITRLYAMYQRSRKILIFLVAFFLAVNITCAAVLASSRISGVEIVFSGTYQCGYTGGNQHLVTETWILTTAWEVTMLCLAVWIVAKYFRELRPPSARSTIQNYFRVLIKTHAFYFVAYAAVACLNLGSLSPSIGGSSSLGVYIYNSILQIAQAVQMFVLGPRLILSVRKCHAERMADPDDRSDTSTVAFRELVHKSTGSAL
ncbi:uncharacterized protein EDB93DRAFT_1256182 [Suillus bovinus]|uniref:uncharacterized protein n=1 Tax=Suillus bovinus TaxID=48563 RepID=UPI001B85B56D|nr:uncharacterized protein EDB93DRAFT_1256182 [Suillus bovinus]KAG2129643.1 hypothetical protein EDB93DRAFT_1256182 [Suillus bovinus]